MRSSLGGVRALSAIVCAIPGLFAQSAELSGIVKDPSGASIPKAHLELRNRDTGVRVRSGTNEDGLYSFPILKPGAYDATVQADGFRTLTRSRIELNVGDRAGLDFSMELGGIASSVTVTAENPMTEMNTVDGSVSTVVDNQFVDNMPLNGRSFQSLIYIVPGVTMTPAYQDAPGQFSVNGQRPNANYFMIDGVSANFGGTVAVTLGQTINGSIPGLNIMGGTNGLVSVDAIQEFRISTSTYAPEFGRTPGAQISIVTKSGTNQFHGTAYDYLRNSVFDARNWFNMVPQPKPPLRQNDFGGVFSGPILKDHTFFLVSYEGLRLRQPDSAEADFLTAAARDAAAAVYRPFVDALPLPNGPVNPDGITAPLTASFSDPSSFNATSVRVDHFTGGRVTLFARYDHAPSTQGSQYFNQLLNYVGNADTATAGATIIVSPTKVNDFRFNWSRWSGKAAGSLDNTYGAVVPPESAIFPASTKADSDEANFDLAFEGLVEGFLDGTRANNVQRQLNFIDTFSMTAGVHQLKFGVDVRRMEPTNSAFDYLYGAYVDDYATLLAGQVNATLVLNSVPITVRFFNTSLFTQDTWKVNPRLTVTYGLRWEINTPPVSTNPNTPVYAVSGIFDPGPIGFVKAPLWHTRFNNFAPRIGGAWKITPNSVVRGGFGLFYDLGYGSATPLSYQQPYAREAYASYDPAIPFDLNGPAFQPLPFSTAILPNASLSAIDPRLKSPFSYQWNAAWERSFGASQTFTAGYVGSWGQNLLRQDELVPPGSIVAEQQGHVHVTYNAGYSHYDGLQFQYMRRLSRGVQALLSYTLAKSTDTGSSDTGISVYDNDLVLLAGNISGLKSELPPLAPSDFDIRNTFSAAVSWQLPMPARISRLRALLKDWALDGIVRARSALPVNVYYQEVLPYYSNTQPDMVPGQPFWIQDANQPEHRVLNPNAFAIPASAPGNFPRNSLRGFAFSQADVALRRRVALTERLSLDARVEYFNVFNHPNFGNPEGLWGEGTTAPIPGFGQVFPGNTLNVALGGGGLGGGQAAIYAPGGPRSAQITLKLHF